MAIINKERKYKWEFDNIGGSSRVRISKGEDIRHLAELDPKMWTVLSCPVQGLEIDDKSLAYIDSDSDGRMRQRHHRNGRMASLVPSRIPILFSKERIPLILNSLQIPIQDVNFMNPQSRFFPASPRKEEPFQYPILPTALQSSPRHVLMVTESSPSHQQMMLTKRLPLRLQSHLLAVCLTGAEVRVSMLQS